MSPGYSKLFEFSGALLVAMGAMTWWRQDSDEENEMVIAANDLVLESLSDADTTRTVECVTDRNWRNDVSVEEAERLNEERELRKMGNRRN